MYYLAYIRGINRNDTPYFSNNTNQVRYFSNKIIKEINSNYPPYYKNKICISSDDINFRTQFNYVILLFNTKYYYYFVDSIKYINEDLIEISISMDTIQTFMFDIVFNESDVIRESINRWNGDNINRDYVRENLSIGNFINKTYNVRNTNPVMIIKTSNGFSSPQATIGTTDVIINGSIFSDGFTYCMLPTNIPSNIMTISFYRDDDEPLSMSIEDYYSLINRIISCPNTIDIKYIKYPNFYGFNVSYVGTVCKITCNSTYANPLIYRYESTGISYYYLYIHKLVISSHNEIYLLSNENNEIFTTNNSISSLFDTKYVPQLIDENYMQYKYGERLGYTSYPLHKLNYFSLYNYNTVDYVNGNRIYTVTDNNEIDVFFTTITNNTNESFGLLTDAWNEYYSRNQGYLTTGVALAKQKAIVQTASGVVTAGIGIATGGVGLAVAGSRGISSLTDGAMSLYSIDQQLKANKENLEYTPDTEKQGNYAVTDILNNSLDIITRVDIVNDLYDVAFKLEKFGYKVNKHYLSVNILNELNNRYYYNIIQCDNMNISLSTINDEETIQRIIDRFKIGLRLWNVNNSNFTFIGDYTYDNVENENL